MLNKTVALIPTTIESLLSESFVYAESPTYPLKISTWYDLDQILKPIAWSWDRWLPKGFLSILASESGLGKSVLLLYIAGCIINQNVLPDNQSFVEPSGAVLWCEAESGQAINVERAKKYGLPLEKLYTLLENPLDDLNLENPAHKTALAEKAFLPEVQLIVIDSLSGADPKAEKSTEDASNIRWLATLARDCQKPILMSHHLRKRSLFDTDSVSLERLRGSSSIVQVARVVWSLDVPDPQNREWRRLQVVKSNLGKFPDPIGMTITDEGVKFGAAPESPRVETIADRATELLMSLLQKEPRSANDIRQELEDAGVSWRSAERAKAKLGIASVKVDGRWLWSLPARGGDDDAE